MRKMGLKIALFTIRVFIYIKLTYSQYRLEAKSEKGPSNHFRRDGMLEDVTHASSLVWPLMNIFCLDDT